MPRVMELRLLLCRQGDIMANVIMVQGTMSNVGKSFIVAGLCRILKQDGYKVAPFKSQNMALNSYITNEGLEMGRAQVMQAEAAKIEPMVCMNPILLKPTSNMGSQVIVNGEVIGNMKAKDYFKYKKKLLPDIKKAYEKLADMVDVIVIEGAGSPAEINLKENDIVNMGMAELVDAPVILVGDIDRGGVFAQLLGTLMLLENSERERVKGLVINKFRGDKTILDPGIDMIEEMGKVPVVGVVPYMDVMLEDEDSLTERFDKKKIGLIDIAVIRYPRISNFTDFNTFEQMEEVSVRYVTSVQELVTPDMIILPGSKNTIGDLRWLRQNGLEAVIKRLSERIPVFGICGGFQMLGNSINDTSNTEEGGIIRGMELLNIDTVMETEKTRCHTSGIINELKGIFAELSGKEFEGYEIHMGKTSNKEDVNKTVLENGQRIYGTYVHGIFDKGEISKTIIKALAEKKGVDIEGKLEDYSTFKEKQYDKLADILRQYMDMESVYNMLELDRDCR